MTLSERFAKLEERERKLLTILGAVVGVLLLLVVPGAIISSMATKRDENTDFKSVLAAIDDARSTIADRNARRDAVLAKYSSPAPPLAGFIEQAAKGQNLTAADTQDKPETPHGKHYNERHTVIKMHKIGMASFVAMLQSIETSGHPVAITRLSIKPRSGEPDQYDVEVGVSAYDRKSDGKTPAAGPSASASAEPEEDKQ